MAFQWSLAALEAFMADQHPTVLRAFSVVELWRLRRVCRAFHRWGTAALAALPRVLAVGGLGEDSEDFDRFRAVEMLDLSTLRWSSGAVPALPHALHMHSACAFGDGRVVVAGGDEDEEEPYLQTSSQWTPGDSSWTRVPVLMQEREYSAAVALPDGRAMVIGGQQSPVGHDANLNPTSEVLAADGSAWSALAPCQARNGAAATALPCGKVLVAGGYGCPRGEQQWWKEQVLNTAELWDPATGAWSDLPPMAEYRKDAGACVLPSGRVAVVGGYDEGRRGKRGASEAFDRVEQTWHPLPPMAHARAGHGLVAVAGGMLAVGGTLKDGAPNELFDEASGRWFKLPHPMAHPRLTTCAVSLPAAAARKAARQARTMALAACAAQVRDIGPLSAEEKARFEQEAGW